MKDYSEIGAVVVFTAMGVGLGAVILALIKGVTWYLRKKGAILSKRGKYETYECGVPKLASTRERFDVRFYRIALLFVLFDIETVFLLPYAVKYKDLQMEGFLAVLVFVAVLGLGLLYLIRRGALEWD